MSAAVGLLIVIAVCWTCQTTGALFTLTGRVCRRATQTRTGHRGR